MVRQAVPLQPMEVHGGANIHLQPVEDPTPEQFVKNCSPWEGLTLQKFMEDCLPWEGPHAGAGEECEEKGAAETMCDELTATPIPCSSAPLRRRRWRNGE